ncbi:zinc finger protein 157-like [Elgaria multicarinata webbii]|uniref:zinc finger protein 157-like n=1 Tax=Elgaria multicarinata webbii TaxID=159646 RepID=UPI002FCD6B5C
MYHQRVLTGERPHKCTECGSSFCYKKALTKHMRTYTGKKPFSCVECGRKFATKCSLQSHQKTRMGEKPFKYRYCGKNYWEYRRRQRHKEVYTGKRPTCPECGKQSQTERELLIRQRLSPQQNACNVYTHMQHVCGKQEKKKRRESKSCVNRFK